MKKSCTKKENEALLQRILEGDVEAKARFVEGNMAYVVMMVNAFLKSDPKFKHLRNDLISEGYLTLVKIVQSVRHNNNPQGFVWTALRNAFVRMVKREKPCERLAEFATYVEDGIKDLRQDIVNCCEDDFDLQIIRLRQHGYNDVEIAGICGVSQQCINKRKLRVINRLSL